MLCERDVFSGSLVGGPPVGLGRRPSSLVLVPRSRSRPRPRPRSCSRPSFVTLTLPHKSQVSHPRSLARSLSLSLSLSSSLAMSAPLSVVLLCRSASPKPVSPPPPEADEPVLPLALASAVPLAASLPSPQLPSEVVVP